MSSYSYTTRKILSGRPGLSTSYTYSVSPNSLIAYRLLKFVLFIMPIFRQSPTPSRQYVAVDTPGRNSSTSESSYSRTYSSTNSTGGGPGGSHITRSETTTRNTGSGPRSYSYTTESHRSSDGPGGSFSSVSYKSPYGNNYRNFSTR
jgi:hypothetical protein